MKAVLGGFEPVRLLLAAAFRQNVDDLPSRVIFRPRRNCDSRYALRYAFSVLATVAALYVRLAFGDIPSGSPAFAVLLVPIVLCAWLGGLGPGLVATVLATPEANYFLLAPIHTLAIKAHAIPLALVSFGLTGMLVSVACEILQRGRRRAEDSELRQRFLGQASATLARSLDYAKIAQGGN